MKIIKYKIDGEIKSSSVFIDDLRMVRNRWGKVQAKLYLIGFVYILEVDDQKVTPKNFLEVWKSGDMERRYKRSYHITNPIVIEGSDYLEKFYSGSEYIHVAGKFAELVTQTEDWDDVVHYHDVYEKFKANGGSYMDFMSDE